MIEISINETHGLLLATCRCNTEAVIIDASDVEISAADMKADLITFINHVRGCPAGGESRARVDKLLAERFPKVP